MEFRRKKFSLFFVDVRHYCIVEIVEYGPWNVSVYFFGSDSPYLLWDNMVVYSGFAAFFLRRRQVEVLM